MKYILTYVLVLVISSFPAQAQVSQEQKPQAQVSFLGDLAVLNRVKPQQNPKYERARDILDRRVLDRRSRVIGEVRDVVVDRGGTVSSLLVVFNRLHLKQEVFLNYNDLSVKGGYDDYELALLREDVRDMYPQLLANIETAAGDDDLLSLRNVKGTWLYNAHGKKLGRITDVLFSSDGRRAEAIYAEIDYGSLRDVGVAIPFNAAMFREKRGRLQAVLGPQESTQLVDFAKRL